MAEDVNPKSNDISITGEDSAESLIEVTKKLKKKGANQRIVVQNDNGALYLAIRVKGKWYRTCALTGV